MVELSAQRQKSLTKFTIRLGIEQVTQVRWELLHIALTHPSMDGQENYEQLEFLGDSVVRIVASRLLWNQQPQASVGKWSATRSVLVSDRTLAEIAESLGFDQFLRVGAGTVSDRKGKASRLADAFEAVLGALFISDETLGLILPWLEPIFQRYIHKIQTEPAYQNHKAALQEWTQRHLRTLPDYRVKSTSQTEHDPSFEAEVWIQEKCFGRGQGRSHKAAEKAAAQVALAKLLQSDTFGPYT
ncbi:MAG: ribonuclease III [Cyanobacteria bacterium P01_F01_bin.42]